MPVRTAAEVLPNNERKVAYNSKSNGIPLGHFFKRQGNISGFAKKNLVKKGFV